MRDMFESLGTCCVGKACHVSAVALLSSQNIFIVIPESQKANFTIKPVS